jgi:hypothetical protein
MFTQHISDMHGDGETGKTPILSIWRKINEREEQEQSFSDTDTSSDESDEASTPTYLN